MKFEWKYLSGHSQSQSKTMRAKVIGGWVLLHRMIDEDFGSSESMVFVSDQGHLWEID